MTDIERIKKNHGICEARNAKMKLNEEALPPMKFDPDIGWFDESPNPDERDLDNLISDGGLDNDY